MSGIGLVSDLKCVNRLPLFKSACLSRCLPLQKQKHTKESTDDVCDNVMMIVLICRQTTVHDMNLFVLYEWKKYLCI